MKRFFITMIISFLILMACGEDTTGPEEWADGATLYLGSSVPDTALSWSPTGYVILFSSFANSSYGIWGYDGITDPVIVAGSTYNESCGPTGCWSYDQGLIVYTARNSALSSEIRTVPGNLGPLLTVIDDGKNHMHPTWTPDQDSLLLCTYDNGHWGLWKTDYNEDSLLVPVPFYTPDFDCLRPSYSPDGQYILFQVKNWEESDIWIMGADGSDPHAVIQDDYDNIHPCWGPVSDHFAFSSNRSGNYEIWISNLDGSQLVQVTDDPDKDIYPAWNPDYGSFLFCSNRRNGDTNYDIFAIDAPDY